MPRSRHRGAAKFIGESPRGRGLTAHDLTPRAWTARCWPRWRSLMAALDTLVVSTALSTIRLDLGASVEQLEWTVNAYNLSFAVLLMTGAALGDRFGRRRLLRRRAGRSSPLASAACALAPERRRADRGARAPGRRRGVRDAARPHAAERRLPARAARRGDRHLQRDHRPRRRERAARRRRGRRGHRLARGSSGSTCRSASSLIPLVLRRMRGELRAATPRSTSPASRWSRRGALGHRLGARARQRAPAGAALEVVGALAGGRRCWSRRSSPGSCARREPMLPMRFFRSRALLGGQRARSSSTFASLFGARLLLRPVPADRRSATAPLDAGLRLLPWTATLFFVAPVAGALVDRIGERPFMVAGLPLQAVGLGWIALIAEPGLAYAAAGRAADASPASASRWRSRPRRTPSSAPWPRRARQGRRRQQHDARARRRLRHRGRGRGLRAAPAATPPRRRSPTASPRR